jgi:SAM-dependent methyltransferase
VDVTTRAAGDDRPLQPPSAWLLQNLDLLRPGGLVLDVAAGRGRHTLFLAARGWRVQAIDRDRDALAALAAQVPAGADVHTEAIDLESGPPSLDRRAYDAVVVFHYLHRPLMPILVDAVAEDGVLVYETFTIDQAARGHPKNPAFLLQPGELAALAAPLEIVRQREGEFEGRCVSSVVARRRRPRST